MKVAVVILNWNGRKFLEQFLPNVIACTADAAEIIIADNASSDDSIVFMQKNYPQIRLIQNSQNGGFAKGYNDALKQVDADYYVLLNSDVEVSPKWVEPIIELMEFDPMIACVQPKIRSYYQRDHFEYAGASGGFIDAYGYPFCRGRMFDTLEEDKGQYDDVREVFWTTGAAMFVRAELYHQYGGLDEDFFAHQEEIDFCWRLKNKGYKMMVCPQSVVYHVGGGTLPKSSTQKTYLNFRNNLVLLYKNLPAYRFYMIFLCRVILDTVAFARFVALRSAGEARAVCKAYSYFFKHQKQNSQKRKAIQPRYPLSDIWRHGLVWNYYLRGIRKFSQIKKL